MVRLVESQHHLSLEDYETVAHIGSAVHDLRQEARSLMPTLQGRTVWMVNSTPRGGGVAELLPPLVTLMSELGVETKWLVMETDDADFFHFTKHLHNLVQGDGDPAIRDEQRDLYEKVNRETAEGIEEYVEPGDVVVVHDPQPMAAGAFLRESADIVAIWRCHIGLDAQTPQTEAAWDFLCRYAAPYDHAVFTAPEYIPSCLSGKSTVLHPGIDPLSHKNRELPVHKIVGILANGGLVATPEPVPSPPFEDQAKRLQPDGTWTPAAEPDDFGLLYRPIVTQVSRWDHLKGYRPLLDGFVRFKEKVTDGGSDLDELQRRTLELVRLVLAGPDPSSVQDDPDAQAELDRVAEAYTDLPRDVADDIAIITLPMSSPKENALLVNSLHRCSDVVVQNSLREGFGLTATEAMWKRIAMIVSSAAGLRQQVRQGLNGHVVEDPRDPDEIADALHAVLRDQKQRELYGHNAQQRVHNDFLIFAQVRSWLELITDTVVHHSTG